MTSSYSDSGASSTRRLPPRHSATAMSAELSQSAAFAEPLAALRRNSTHVRGSSSRWTM
jgi:hypothetical protein